METQEARQQNEPQEARPKGYSEYDQLNESVKTVADLRKEVVEQRGLLIVGAIILLVMVGTVITMVLLSWVDSNVKVLDKVDSLQIQVSQISNTYKNK